MTPALEPPKRQHRPPISAPFPYHGDGTGGLSRLTTSTTLLSDDADAPNGAPGALDCPVCGDALVNGAGRFFCPDCAWTGRLD